MSYNNYSKVTVNMLYFTSCAMIQNRLKPFFFFLIFFHVQRHFYFEKSIREWRNKIINLGRCKTVSRKFFWSTAALFGVFRNGCDSVTDSVNERNLLNGSVVLLSPFFLNHVFPQKRWCFFHIFICNPHWEFMTVGLLALVQATGWIYALNRAAPKGG